MANDLASWLRESQVVSMCLKLATPRTLGGLNKTQCIKVRKMKRRSLHWTYPTFNDTVQRYHQCQWNIYTAEPWRRNFSLTHSLQTSSLSLRMLMQRRNRTKTTKAMDHFFVYFIFYQATSPFLHEPISVHRSLPKGAVCNRLWQRYLLHFIIQTVNWDCRLCTAHQPWAHQLDIFAASWQRKRRGKSALSIAVTPVLDASAIAQLIAVMKGWTSMWHNTPQASICAREDIMSASPVVSTRIYNI